MAWGTGAFSPIEPRRGSSGSTPPICGELFGEVPPGKYTATFRFRSPVAPAQFVIGQKLAKGKTENVYKKVPAEISAKQWAKEAGAAPVAFEIAALAKDDLVVHEWGVFTVFNDAKYANLNRKQEWGSLPSFFYRQFPTERLRWVPSAWDKPIRLFLCEEDAAESERESDDVYRGSAGRLVAGSLHPGGRSVPRQETGSAVPRADLGSLARRRGASPFS